MPPRTGVRWGIVGCARIAKRGLIPAIARSNSGVLCGIASRDEAKARAWASEYGIPKVYGSYQGLLADPEIDAVYIPLPNELHRTWVLAGSGAGKHVLCEKPLALNGREASDMVDACRTHGVILMEAFMWRHQPRMARIRQMVHQGDIGELRVIRSSFSFPIAPDDWRLDPSRGGGALWDVGCYCVNTARFFTGEEPSRFHSFARFWPSGVDLSLTALLDFPSGVLAIIDCSFEQPFRCHCELSGTRGLIDVPLAYLPAAGSKPTAALTQIASEENADSRPQESRSLEFEPIDQYTAMVDHFAGCVTAGKLLEPGEDGLDQMVALDQVLAASLVGRRF
jgi:D-xylose 1-dehydrogenase (NADP+, D-xylono-1,5-lactone-forming)